MTRRVRRGGRPQPRSDERIDSRAAPRHERLSGSRQRLEPAPRRRDGPAPLRTPPAASQEDAARLWIFGIHPVREALEAERPISVLFRARDLKDPRITEVTRLAQERGVGVVRVPRDRLERLSGGRNHQGLAAQCSPVRLVGTAEALAGQRPATGRLWLMLDGVTDEGNAGSLVRSAVALGTGAVLVAATGGVRPGPGLMRAASGAAERISWVRLHHPIDELSRLKRDGFRLMGATVGRGRLPQDSDRIGDRVLVLGSEDRGIRREIDALLDVRLRIPTVPSMPSLNVAAAGAILLAAVGPDLTGR